MAVFCPPLLCTRFLFRTCLEVSLKQPDYSCEHNEHQMNTAPGYDHCKFSAYTNTMQGSGLEAIIWLIKPRPLQICSPVMDVSVSILKISSLCTSLGNTPLGYAHARIIHLKRDQKLPSYRNLREESKTDQGHQKCPKLLK